MRDTFLRKPWVLVACAGLMVACATLTTKFGTKIVDQLKVPHAAHQSAGVKCAKCHKGIAESRSLSSDLMPKKAQCGGCHDVADPAMCDQCHTDPKAAVALERKEVHLNFPHGLHLAKPEINGECSHCHSSAEPPTRPAMEACTGCHNHEEDYQQGRCSMCHQDLTRYQLRPVADFSHEGNFLREHRLSARSAGASCTQCHEQTFCVECHGKTEALKVEEMFPERVDRSFIHRNDYVGRHTVEARADSASCLRCHGKSYCEACHASHALTPQAPGTLNPHPSSYGGTGPSAHGAEARRDIVRCAACHDQGANSICVNCHVSGGVGGNPHPASWVARHSREEIRTNSMCQVCHR